MIRAMTLHRHAVHPGLLTLLLALQFYLYIYYVNKRMRENLWAGQGSFLLAEMQFVSNLSYKIVAKANTKHFQNNWKKFIMFSILVYK